MLVAVSDDSELIIGWNNKKSCSHLCKIKFARPFEVCWVNLEFFLECHTFLIIDVDYQYYNYYHYYQPINVTNGYYLWEHIFAAMANQVLILMMSMLNYNYISVVREVIITNFGQFIIIIENYGLVDL